MISPAPMRVHCGTPGGWAPGCAGSVKEKKEALLQLGARLTGSPRRRKRFAYLNKCSRQSDINHNDAMNFLRNRPQRDAERARGHQGELRVRKARQAKRRAERERANSYLGPKPFASPTKETYETLTKAVSRRTYVDSRKRVLVKSDQLLRLQNSTRSGVTSVR